MKYRKKSIHLVLDSLPAHKKAMVLVEKHQEKSSWDQQSTPACARKAQVVADLQLPSEFDLAIGHRHGLGSCAGKMNRLELEVRLEPFDAILATDPRFLETTEWRSHV